MHTLNKLLCCTFSIAFTSTQNVSERHEDIFTNHVYWAIVAGMRILTMLTNKLDFWCTTLRLLAGELMNQVRACFCPLNCHRSITSCELCSSRPARNLCFCCLTFAFAIFAPDGLSQHSALTFDLVPDVAVPMPGLEKMTWLIGEVSLCFMSSIDPFHLARILHA